jgi:predicted  nucleic acid-binding Zn-ribbon protein
MNRGLAISTVLLLLAAIWLPLAGGQEAPDREFSPQLGDDLSAYGRGYVENLMLWSGAGIHLEWGPSFNGNGTALDERLLELETAAGDDMPNMSAPLVVPFADVDPAFEAPAPIDQREQWMWNLSDVAPRVDLGGVSATIIAETHLASGLMEGGALDAEGLLMVQAAHEAAHFIDHRLGWNGTALGPINMTDPNMTDTNASNGWWLPAHMVLGEVNGTTGAWENEVIEQGPTLMGSLMALQGLLALGNYLADSDELVGAGKPFPAGTDTQVLALADAVFKNTIAVYYEEASDLFVDDEDAMTDAVALAYMAMVDYSETDDMVEYFRGWASHRAKRFADLLVELQNDDGTLAPGVSTAIGGIPGAYIPPYMAMSGVAGHGPHAMAAMALFEAWDRFEGRAYHQAAMACLAADDTAFWNDVDNVFVADKMAETTSAQLSDQVAGLGTLSAAVETGDVDLSRYRLGQLWTGMVGAGLQLSETDANGENYTMVDDPDTNNNTIWKHDRDKELGNEHGSGPVLAHSSVKDMVTGNWSVRNDGEVNTHFLMRAAALFLMMDGDWFEKVGSPEVSEETAYRLLHWTPDQWREHTDDLDEQVTNLTDKVQELQDIIDNGTGTVEDLLKEIASLEENLTAMEEDLNESRENETILRGQVEWLRERLEETNETVDDLEQQIVVLESQVERLEESVGDKDENITKLRDQLRSSENNVTQLQWQLDNASAALAQAQLDLDAANRELDDTKQELEDQKDRQVLVAVAALVAGMVIVVILLRLTRKEE